MNLIRLLKKDLAETNLDILGKYYHGTNTVLPNKAKRSAYIPKWFCVKIIRLLADFNLVDAICHPH